MRALTLLETAFARQHGHLLPWAPVCLGVGIGTYFALPTEPGRPEWLAAAASCLAAALLGWRVVPARPVLAALAIAILGFGLAGLRTERVAEPVLAFRYYGPVEGRIVAIDRSYSDRTRLTLDEVYLSDVAPGRTPTRVRVSLHGDQDFLEPKPGQRVALTANLSPPEGPVEPGGFDFQRQAFFDRLGAVGYTRTPVLLLAPANPAAWELWVNRIRMRISQAMQKAMPGDVGGFAAAVTTGDRSGMSQRSQENLRAANTAHLLAISGLHMGLLTGFVFAAVRYGLAIVPLLALRLPLKKIAAVVALVAGTAYLLLSGGNVATERAYIMASVMLVAVLLDRRAISLRAIAVAAMIVLTLRPEVLTEPGFQMSFAATVALVACFGELRRVDGWRAPQWLKPVSALFLSSVIAGAATAPIGAAHFNQLSHYGLLANMVSVPLMGLLIVPGSVAAAVLAPVGLGWIGLAVMEPAIAWILWVAGVVAGWEGATSSVVAPGAAVMPLFALGMLWLILWQGRGRLAGAVPVVAAFALWAATERPAVLVTASGGLVGVLTQEGRAFNKPKGDGFAAESWLENDGDRATQEAAAIRAGFVAAPEGALAVEGWPILHVSGRDAAARAARLCTPGVVVVLTAEIEAPLGPCALLDPRRLGPAGGVVIDRDAAGALVVTEMRDVQGDRAWTRRSPDRGRNNGPRPDLLAALLGRAR